MSLQLLENTQWAITKQGQNISLYASPKFPFKTGKRPILFIGGTHGDEPEGVKLATELLSHLQQLIDDKKYTYSQEWLLIPNINPDGYKLKQRTNANGVDLNRNYPATNWSPQFKQARYYPGKSPQSELETQALVKLIQEENPRLIIHFHSWKACIVYTGKKAFVDAKRLATISGYELKEEIGYPTPGSLGQFASLDLNIPVICIEEEEGIAPESIWPRFSQAFHEILMDTSLRDTNE